MAELQDWVEGYKELSTLITEKVPDIKWIDLWMEQTSHEEDEYPFPTPAVFLDFSANNIDELGDNVQLMHMQVTVLVAMETLADSYQGAQKQGNALKFGELCRKVHQALHGTAGVHFGPMTRVAMRKEVAPPYVQLYSQTYATEIMDTSTAPVFVQDIVGADRQELERGVPPPAPAEPPLYQIP